MRRQKGRKRQELDYVFEIFTCLWLTALALVPFLVSVGTAQAQDRNCDHYPFVMPDLAVTVTLNGFEREVLSLAIPGYLAALQGEVEGATAGGFQQRADGLGAFINITVPCIQYKINANADQGGGHDAGDLTVTFNNFERVAGQIMTRIWNSGDGVLSHHVTRSPCHHAAGCGLSVELTNASLCPTVAPLALAAETLYTKVTADQ